MLMKLPAAAYSAEVATSATKAGSYGVFGEGESACSLVSLSRPVAVPFVPAEELFFNSHSSRETSLEVF
jgi:hypothetical protein